MSPGLFTRRGCRRCRIKLPRPFRFCNGYVKIKYQDASKDYEAALEYPDNLEVGRPYLGGRASQTYHFIGTVYEALGDQERARRFYEKSSSL